MVARDRVSCAQRHSDSAGNILHVAKCRHSLMAHQWCILALIGVVYCAPGSDDVGSVLCIALLPCDEPHHGLWVCGRRTVQQNRTRGQYFTSVITSHLETGCMVITTYLADYHGWRTNAAAQAHSGCSHECNMCKETDALASMSVRGKEAVFGIPACHQLTLVIFLKGT